MFDCSCCMKETLAYLRTQVSLIEAGLVYISDFLFIYSLASIRFQVRKQRNQREEERSRLESCYNAVKWAAGFSLLIFANSETSQPNFHNDSQGHTHRQLHSITEKHPNEHIKRRNLHFNTHTHTEVFLYTKWQLSSYLKSSFCSTAQSHYLKHKQF